MSSRRRPPKLQPGMTIGIVTPSSPVRDRGRIERSVAVLASLGFRTVFGAHAHDRRPYRAEDDRSRADDLLAMFFRDDVDAVMCVQGGYGGIRTMRWLDADRLAQLAQRPPKPFLGFSDITYYYSRTLVFVLCCCSNTEARRHVCTDEIARQIRKCGCSTIRTSSSGRRLTAPPSGGRTLRNSMG